MILLIRLLALFTVLTSEVLFAVKELYFKTSSNNRPPPLSLVAAFKLHIEKLTKNITAHISANLMTVFKSPLTLTCIQSNNGSFYPLEKQPLFSSRSQI